MPDDTFKVKALITLGQQYESNLPDTAISYYRQSGTLSEKLHYPAGLIRYIANYTAVLNVQGKLDESLKLNLQAVDISRKYGLKQQLVKCLINTGTVYQLKENYAVAAAYYLQALPLLEAAGNYQNLSLQYGNLCGLYRNLKQPQKALKYARLAVQFAEKGHDQFAAGSAYINLGNSLKDAGDVKDAITYLQRSLQIGSGLKDDNTKETAMIGLGDAYLQLKKPEQYILFFTRSLPLAEAINDVSGKAFALQGIALGLFAQKHYNQAELFLDKAIRYATQRDQKEVLSRMLMLMSDVQIALGNLNASQQYRSKYDSVSNILLNAPLLKNIQELETKYDVEKKRREILQKNILIEQKDQQTQRQQQWLIAALIGIVFLGALILLLYLVYLQKQQLNRRLLEVLKSEQETLRLKATLEGEQQERRRISQEMHDDMGAGLTRMLFLSRAMPDQDGVPGKISAAAEELIKKMNEVIWTMNDEQDTLDSLVAYIRLTVVEMLENAGLSYQFNISDPLPDAQLDRGVRRNIYLAVKEAVHNVIRHAGATMVSIAVIYNGKLEIWVKDNGMGLGNTGKQRFGNGLKNMRSRMQRIGGIMDIVDEKGALVRFDIPLKL